MSFGYVLGHIWYYIIPIRKKVTYNNIRLAFPDWNEKKVRQCHKETLIHLCQIFAEYGNFKKLKNKKFFNKYVEFRGKEHLEKAFSLNKGVLVLGMHNGNGELSIASLCQAGFKMVLLGRKIKDPDIDKGLAEIRSCTGLELLPAYGPIKPLLKAIRDNKGVIFVPDQFVSSKKGSKSYFFGRPTYTGSGLATLYFRFKCPIVFTFAYREGLKWIIEARPVQVSHEDNVETLTQKFSNLMESVIKEDPKLWLWVHKRWKKVDKFTGKN